MLSRQKSRCSRKAFPCKCCRLISKGSWVLTSKATTAPKKGQIAPNRRFSRAGRRLSGHNGSNAVLKYLIYQKGDIVDWGSDLHRLRSQEGSREHFLEKEESFGKGKVKPERSSAESSSPQSLKSIPQPHSPKFTPQLQAEEEPSPSSIPGAPALQQCLQLLAQLEQLHIPRHRVGPSPLHPHRVPSRDFEGKIHPCCYQTSAMPLQGWFLTEISSFLTILAGVEMNVRRR